jgi:TonB C terminal
MAMVGGPVRSTVAQRGGQPAPHARQNPGSERAARLDSTASSAARTPPSEPEAVRSSRSPMSDERARPTLALLLSLLLHALLLSLTLGGQGLGPVGFGLPWRERRSEASDLRFVLVPARVPVAALAGPLVKEPLSRSSIEPPAATGSALALTAPAAPTPAPMATAMVPKAGPAAGAVATPKASPQPVAATATLAANAPLPTEGSGEAAPTVITEPVVIAMERADEAMLAVPAAAALPAPVIAAAPSASSPPIVMPAPRDAGVAAQERIEAQARERADELVRSDRSQREAQQLAAQLEAARAETARQESERQESERQEAARHAAAREDTARQEAQRVDSARLESERQAAARQAAASQETARQEAARQEARRVENARLEAERQEAARQATASQEIARQEAARQEAQRAESARLEAERREAGRQATARQETARVDAAQDEARREARLRAIGRQLDEEAARRDAAAAAAGAPSRLAPSSSGARRGRLFGRSDPNAELILYAEAFARKIQLNMTFDMVREAAQRPHTQPLVTVAIRADGSVESVTFVLSSGVAEIDEAIRRIVQSQLPYPAFPPGLARQFDVIEIRRTWHFDSAIRLY